MIVMGQGGAGRPHLRSAPQPVNNIGAKLLPLPFQPALGVAKTTLNFTQSDGEPAVMTFHSKHAGTDPWSVADLSLLNLAFSVWFSTGDGTHSYKSSCMANDCTVDSYESRDLTVDGSTIDVLALAEPGGLSGGPLANGLAFCVTAESGLTGRSNRGRSFCCCLAKSFASASDANQADASAATNLLLAFNALPAAISGYAGTEAAHLCVCSRFHAGVRLAAANTVPIIGYHSHDLALDFQRRRAPSHNR